MSIELLEPRTLRSVAGLDPTYGIDGVARVVKANNFAAVTLPNFDGGAIVEVSGTDIRRLDARGTLVKSFGGGDGVLTPTASAALIAVDSATGRLALYDDTDGVPIVRFYGSNGNFERAITTLASGAAIPRAAAMTFDLKGRLLVSGASALVRLLPSTGRSDASFGTDGVVTIPTHALPAGEPVDYGEGDDGGATSTDALLVRPAGSADAGGEVTLVREYYVDDSGGASETRTSTYLDVRRFDANGHPAARDAVSTIQIGVLGRADAVVAGHTDEERFDITRNSIAAAADGSLTILGHRSQYQLVGTSRVPSASYSEFQLLRIVGDAIVARRDLDDAFQIPPGEFADVGVTRFAIDAGGTRVVAVGNARVAAFDPRTLKPFASFNGPTGALQLTSRSFEDATIDARGRLLLNSARRVIAVRGPADDVVGAPAGRATLLGDDSLAVEGTSKEDVISVGYGTKRRIKITVDGHVQYFNLADVHGIYVHGGKGDDRIDASTLSPQAGGIYAQAGSGDDTIVGSPRADTVEAGDGHDAFDGGDRFYSSDDANLAFGFAVDDVLANATRVEELLLVTRDPLFA